MGVADFYVKISVKTNNINEYKMIFRPFTIEQLFRVLDDDYNNSCFSIECNFDSLLPSVVILFNKLKSYKNYIIKIETHGISSDYKFENEEDLLSFIFISNKERLLNFYHQMGYLSIDQKDYYIKRNRLKKYIHKKL